MKAYTDIEQSKKLAEILPLESADMHYSKDFDGSWFVDLTEYTSVKIPKYVVNIEEHLLPCWSLAALLNLIPYTTLSKQYNGKWNCTAYPKEETVSNCENAIDAAFELVVLLKDEETKMEE